MTLRRDLGSELDLKAEGEEDSPVLRCDEKGEKTKCPLSFPLLNPPSSFLNTQSNASQTPFSSACHSETHTYAYIHTYTHFGHLILPNHTCILILQALKRQLRKANINFMSKWLYLPPLKVTGRNTGTDKTSSMTLGLNCML